MEPSFLPAAKRAQAELDAASSTRTTRWSAGATSPEKTWDGCFRADTSVLVARNRVFEAGRTRTYRGRGFGAGAVPMNMPGLRTSALTAWRILAVAGAHRYPGSGFGCDTAFKFWRG